MATYTDNFNRPDSSGIGNWSEHGDDWSIVSNQLRPGGSITSYVLYASPLATADHYSEAVLAVASAVSTGVLARADITGNNFYLWRNNGSTWDLFVNIGGSFTTIGNSYAAAAVNGDVARIECIGSTIKGYVNGVERASATDTQITSGLYAGLRAQQSLAMRYDNFAAGDISAVQPDKGAFLSFMS